MATVSVNSIWSFLQSMSLSASNEYWLADKLLQSASAKKASQNDKRQILANLYGAWANDPDADTMEKSIRDGRKDGYARKVVAFDD